MHHHPPKTEYKISYYYPGNQNLADGTHPSNAHGYCAMKGVPLGSKVIVIANGQTFTLVVKDRAGISKRVDMPSREFASRFGRVGIRKGLISITSIKILTKSHRRGRIHHAQIAK